MTSNTDVDFEIVLTESPDIIKRILTVPEIWDAASEDGADPEKFEPVIGGGVLYLLVKSGRKALGMFVLAPQSETVVAVHTAILPKYWGQRERNAEIGKAVIQWVWDNTDYHKIVSTVPVLYKQVLAYAQRCGMKREGVNRKSFLKNGTLYDQYYVGVVK